MSSSIAGSLSIFSADRSAWVFANRFTTASKSRETLDRDASFPREAEVSLELVCLEEDLIATPDCRVALVPGMTAEKGFVLLAASGGKGEGDATLDFEDPNRPATDFGAFGAAGGKAIGAFDSDPGAIASLGLAPPTDGNAGDFGGKPKLLELAGFGTLINEGTPDGPGALPKLYANGEDADKFFIDEAGFPPNKLADRGLGALEVTGGTVEDGEVFAFVLDMPAGTGLGAREAVGGKAAEEEAFVFMLDMLAATGFGALGAVGGNAEEEDELALVLGMLAAAGLGALVAVGGTGAEEGALVPAIIEATDFGAYEATGGNAEEEELVGLVLDKLAARGFGALEGIGGGAPVDDEALGLVVGILAARGLGALEGTGGDADEGDDDDVLGFAPDMLAARGLGALDAVGGKAADEAFFVTEDDEVPVFTPDKLAAKGLGAVEAVGGNAAEEDATFGLGVVVEVFDTEAVFGGLDVVSGGDDVGFVGE